MKFFTECRTKEELKKTFNKLAKCFHPDKGGSSDLMIELQKQYDEWGGNIHTRLDDFQQQAWDRRFKFNTINRVDPLSFDHPIHSEIRDLKNQIKIKDDQIANLFQSVSSLSGTLEYQKRKSHQLQLDLNNETENVLNLERQIEVLKKKRPLHLLVWHDYLKPYFTGNHEKQSQV